MDNNKFKFVIILLGIICFLLIIQTILIFFLLSNNPYELFSNQTTINLNPKVSLTPSEIALDTPTIIATKSIIGDCTQTTEGLTEIWNNLDASYYYDDNVKICGEISAYEILTSNDLYFSPRFGKLHIVLEKKDEVNFPIDIYLNIPAEINKTIYPFFEMNKNGTICFSGNNIYTSNSKIVFNLENSSDLCIP